MDQGGSRRLLLASASPARLRLLRDAGLRPDVEVSGVDESTVARDDPWQLVAELARMKADAVAERTGTGSLVIGCDSMLAIGGQVLGKPADAGEARARWLAMRGRSGSLLTGHCVVDTTTGRRAAEVSDTVVHFGRPSDAEIDAYVASGEPLQVAGAFTLDGRSTPFVERIEGDPGTVIGLSLPVLRRLLASLGIDLVSLWS